MTRRAWLLTLSVALLLLATALRLPTLADQSFWNDEGNTARLVERPISLILEGAAGDIHPPGYYLLLHVWRALVGETEFALRAYSAYCGILTVAVTIAIARRASRGTLAAVAAGLIAVLHPLSVVYSGEARMYAQLGLLSALTLWAAIGLVDRKDARLKTLGTLPQPGHVPSSSPSPSPPASTPNTPTPSPSSLWISPSPSGGSPAGPGPGASWPSGSPPTPSAASSSRPGPPSPCAPPAGAHRTWPKARPPAPYSGPSSSAPPTPTPPWPCSCPSLPASYSWPSPTPLQARQQARAAASRPGLPLPWPSSPPASSSSPASTARPTSSSS